MATIHRPASKLTYQDYLLFPDDGKRHELMDGEHFMTPAPNTKHQRLLGRLHQAIASFLIQAPIGEAFVAPYDVVLSPFDVCQPDLLFVAHAQSGIITQANIQGAPALVVEILSDASRRLDETIKRQRYERHGVQEYWIVDPELNAIKILRLSEGRYHTAAELTREAQDTLSSPILPGFSLSLTSLFR